MVYWLALLWVLPPLAQAQEDLDEALRKAIRDGEYADAERLLGNPDVDPDDQDGRGFTALMYAARSKQPELVTLLVKARANLDLTNNQGKTALIEAVERGRVDATRLLLMAGADLETRDDSDRTALEWARERNKTYLVQIISIAARPSAAKIILSEKPVTMGSEHLELPRVVEDTPPLYTESAFDRGVEGLVVLRVIIRKDGRVGAIRIHRSLDKGLDRAALAAVKLWKFEPALMDGEPINVLADVEVNFSLQTQS